MLPLDLTDLVSYAHSVSETPVHLPFDLKPVSRVFLPFLADTVSQFLTFVVDLISLLLELVVLPLPPSLFFVSLMLFLLPHIVQVSATLLILLD